MVAALFKSPGVRGCCNSSWCETSIAGKGSSLVSHISSLCGPGFYGVNDASESS